MTKKMTIYEIKRRTGKTSPYFFSPKTLRCFGQTMKDFKVFKQEDGKYLIEANSYWDGKLMKKTRRVFNPVTNDLERVEE